MRTDFYVYILLNPIKHNQPFYIGKGTGYRIKDHFNMKRKNYNPFKTNTIKKIIKKTGKNPPFEIYANNLTNEEACWIEEELIAFYKRRKNGGILTNLTLGGEGTIGIDRSYAIKNLPSNVIGTNNGMYGKNHTEESKKKVSETKKSRYKLKYHWNNGEKSIMTKFPPDETWVRGRLQSHKKGLKIGR